MSWKNDSRIICRYDIIWLPSVDHDHELQVHDIIRLPHEVRVDHDHELQVHDIIRLPSEASADHDPDSQIQFFVKSMKSG